MRRLVVLATLLAPGPALAVEVGEARIDFTTTTIAAYHLDNDDGPECDDNFFEAQERLNMNAFRRSYQVGFRFDASIYASTPEMPAGACNLERRYENRYTPEKIWVGWNGRNIEATVGDSYVQFGRGLTLSLRKVDELGVDTTLRGAKALARSRFVEGTLVAGVTNPANVDEASGRNIADFNDLVAGAQVQARLGGTSVGGQAAMVRYRSPVTGFFPPGEAPEYEETWISAGPSLDAPRLLPNLGLYLEGVAQHRRPATDAVPAETGFGVYGTATIYAGKATILVEGKAYGDLAVVQPRLDQPEQLEFRSVQYTSPPTAERVLQVIENPQKEIAGARARADYRFSRDFVAYVNYGLFRDYLGYAVADVIGNVNATIHDPYAGFEAYWCEARSRALVSAGYRLVTDDEHGEIIRGDGHLDFDVVQAFPHDLSLELHGVHVERTKTEPLGEKSWREGSLQVGLSWKSTLSGAFVLDYTTEAGQPKDLYPSGTVTWDITGDSSLRVYAGSSRGGLKCVSGVCRTFPPFDGIKLTASFRF